MYWSFDYIININYNMKLGEMLDEVLSEDNGKLSVFDFDGTLIDTPMPVMVQRDGESYATSPTWKEKTGEDWKWKGWWGRPESLNMDVFEHPTIPSVISDYKKEKARPNTMVIMLTGRRPHLGKHVKAILDSHGLEFDAYLYNYGNKTEDNKIEQMTNILAENEAIREVEMWDDRTLHIPIFQKWGDNLVENGRLDKFHINHIVNEHFTP